MSNVTPLPGVQPQDIVYNNWRCSWRERDRWRCCNLINLQLPHFLTNAADDYDDPGHWHSSGFCIGGGIHVIVTVIGWWLIAHFCSWWHVVLSETRCFNHFRLLIFCFFSHLFTTSFHLIGEWSLLGRNPKSCRWVVGSHNWHGSSLERRSPRVFGDETGWRHISR